MIALFKVPKGSRNENLSEHIIRVEILQVFPTDWEKNTEYYWSIFGSETVSLIDYKTIEHLNLSYDEDLKNCCIKLAKEKGWEWIGTVSRANS